MPCKWVGWNCAVGVQTRFKEYTTFVKWHQAQVPFRSGCDDEDPPTEIMDGLESMYDDWTSCIEKGKKKRDAVATKKQNDKIGAEALRSAALGQFIARRGGRDEDSPEAKMLFEVPAGTPRSNCSSRSNTPIPGNLIFAIHSLEDSLAQRAGAKLLKEENKKRKLELLQQKMEIDRTERAERLQLERDQFELAKKNQEAQHQLLLTLAAQLKDKSKK